MSRGGIFLHIFLYLGKVNTNMLFLTAAQATSPPAFSPLPNT